MKSSWKSYLLYGSVIIIGGGFLYILVQTIERKNTGFETKTLWDWMELLIIPLVLASGAFFLQRSERASERQVANDRANLEREIAKDRQQEAALQSYIDRMSELLLDNDLRYDGRKEVKDIARVRTISVLGSLDPFRKGQVITFLFEAGLLRGDNPVISMNGADLENVFLLEARLAGVNLSGTNLIGANLNGADLEKADLSKAWLYNAKFINSNLRHANLNGAETEGALLRGANLFEATMPDGTIHE